MPEAAGLLMLALKTWSPPPVSNTSPILNTNLLTHSVTLLLLLTPYLQSESAPAPLTAGHLLSIQLLLPGHRRPTAGLQPALKPGRPVLSRGLGGLPTSGSLCTAPTPPPPSPHSASTQPAPCCPKPPFLRRALPGQAFQSCLLSQILCFFLEEAAIHRRGFCARIRLERTQFILVLDNLQLFHLDRPWIGTQIFWLYLKLVWPDFTHIFK